MKKLILTSVFTIAAMTVACSTLMKTSGFKLPDYETVRLENGLELLLIPNRSLPALSLVMMVESGSYYDPDGYDGLTSLTMNLLEKGSESMTAIEIADRFGFLGSSFSASVSDDYSLLVTSALSKDSGELIDLFSEVALKPRFLNTEIQRLKNQGISSIQRGFDNPSAFASRIFASYLMEGYPYGRSTSGEVDTLKRIGRSDVLSHYKKIMTPNNSRLAVIGDYSSSDLAQIKSRFGAWEPGPRLKRPDIEFPRANQMSLLLVDRPDLQQAQIMMGHVGIRRSSEDFLPVRISNTILGGVFSSRLMREIRVERGLTYGISSSFDAKKDEGPFSISMAVRHDKVGEAIGETLNLVKDYVESGATRQELKDSVSYHKGVFPRALETPEQLATNLLILRYHGISDSYLLDYFKNLDRISTRQLNSVIRERYRPDEFKILVYAPEAQVLDQLKAISSDVKVRRHTEFH